MRHKLYARNAVSSLYVFNPSPNPVQQRLTSYLMDATLLFWDGDRTPAWDSVTPRFLYLSRHHKRSQKNSLVEGNKQFKGLGNQDSRKTRSNGAGEAENLQSWLQMLLD